MAGTAGTLEVCRMSIDDPKAYTRPWVGKPIRFTLRPRVESGGWHGTIEDGNTFNGKIRFPTFVDTK